MPPAASLGEQARPACKLPAATGCASVSPGNVAAQLLTVGADGQNTALLGCLADIGNPNRLLESMELLAVSKAAPL